MTFSRRTFFRLLGAGGVLSALFNGPVPAAPAARSVKPPRLRQGDTVGLINPAGATFEHGDIDVVCDTFEALGLRVKMGRHLLDRYGYLAGRDPDRAADLNAMFADDSVKAICAVRGGWGCNRILPLIEYDQVRTHPKIVLGYSDVTSLLLALYARTGLVTFHGPVGISTWNTFSLEYFRSILFGGEPVTLRNPVTTDGSLVQTKDRVDTITPGTATGVLAGGNLTVLTSMIGSDYLPDWNGIVLFVEDDGELLYRVDRMLTQLGLAGILPRISGFVFGKCTNCGPGEGYGSLTLGDILDDHIRPLHVPAWTGAMIGHIDNKFTVPIGVRAEIDAAAGTIRLLEPAVE